mmetsp:Transcript_53630/g.160560  ORF Transcript_53630/g.160560 Transcript_53630/m.160560 type:complete len:141 (-) Transcript_53630:380-802(-)
MDTTIGPVITEKQLHNNKRKVEEGMQSDLNEKNWYEPTVVAALLEALSDKGSLDWLHSPQVLFQSELFGPVVALVPLQDPGRPPSPMAHRTRWGARYGHLTSPGRTIQPTSSTRASCDLDQRSSQESPHEPLGLQARERN